MSDTPKKKPIDENDAIKQMLDRLRKTIVDAPIEDEPAATEEVELIFDTEEDEELTQEFSILVDDEEDAEGAEILSSSDSEEPDASEAVISEFFTLESDDADAPEAESEEVSDMPAEELSAPAPSAPEAPDAESADEQPDSSVPVAQTQPEQEAPQQPPLYPNAFDGEDLFADAQTLHAEETETENSQFFTLGEEEEDAALQPQDSPEEDTPVSIAPLTPVAEEEEDISSVSTDDFLTALAWDGESNAIAEEEETAAALTAEPLSQDNPSVTEPIATSEESAEEAADEKAEEGDTPPPSRAPLSFFSPVTPTKKAAPACAEEAADTQITSEEAEVLFATRRPASFGEMRARYLASEEGQTPSLEEEIPPFANEDNGYAVEVSVGLSLGEEEKQEPTPASANEPQNTENTPIETVDDSDFGDDRDDGFLSLLGKLTPATEEKKKTPRPQPTEKSPFGSPVSGEQLAMEIFTAEPSVSKEEEPVEEVAPAAVSTPSVAPEVRPSTTVTPPVSEPTTAPDLEISDTPVVNEATETPFFGEMPTKPPAAREAQSPPAFSAAFTAPVQEQIEVEETEEEVLEVELPPEEADADRPAPSFEQTEEKKAKAHTRFSSILKTFLTRLAPAAGESDALSGLYTEEAAAYNEYSSRNQVSAFARKFVSEGSLCTLRIVLLAFLCTFLFALENFTLLGYRPNGALAGREMQIALHLFAVLLSAIASIPVFSRTWHQLFARRVTADLYPSILLILAVVYDILLFFLAPAGFAFFGLVPAIFALLLAIADQRKVKADFASFRLLSSSGDKLACTVSAGGKTEQERAAVFDLAEGEESRIVSMKKVGFATGFFHRIVRNCEDSYQNTILLAAGAFVSLVVAIVLGIIASSFLVAFYSFALTLSLVLPALLPLIHKIPAAMLSIFAANNQCAAVGEVSALEYSDVAAMTFEDVEAFPARNIRIQRIKLYNDSALDRVLYQVSSLFSTVGGPLDSVFRESTAELGIADDSSLLSVADGGLCALVDGHEIRVGRGNYMLDNDVHVFYDPEDERLLSGGKISLMFAAEDGRLVAKFYVRYKMDEAFEKSVESLYRRGIRTLIRTYDPNLSEELVDKISYTADFSPCIVKKTVDQQKDLAVPQMNSGLVTKSASADLLRTLFACRRAVRIIRAGGIAAYALLGIGAVGVILLAAFSVFGSLPSVYFAGYQLLLALLYLLISKITV